MAERCVGVALGDAHPRGLANLARQAEDCGLDEVWLCEDFFYTGGIAGAAIALAATEHLRVGTGVVSAMVRQPALLAMEMATLASAFPERLVCGVGLGAPSALKKIGTLPASALTAMRECVTSMGRLLRGDELTQQGVFAFDHVRLSWLADRAPAIHMGVVGPKMLQLSGEIADGSILGVGTGHSYMSWARENIEIGRLRAGRNTPHRITVYVLYSVSLDAREARAAAHAQLALYMASWGGNAYTDACGITQELLDMIGRGGEAAVAAEMPDAWVDTLAIAGDPPQCAARIRGFHQRGADSVVLVPVPSEQSSLLLDLTGREVLPRLRREA